MRTITEYKNMALQSLEGYWTKAFVASVISFIVMELLGSSFSLFLEPAPATILQGITILVLLPFMWGYQVYFLRLIRRENLDYGHLFDGFSQYLRIFLAELLKVIYIFLWGLLLIIPGIIKEYSYAMTEFILKDNPDMNGEEAICESMRMMQGHKMQLFLLDLSMIGWLILSVLTLGIGLLFLMPYNHSAHAHFYEDLRIEQTNTL